MSETRNCSEKILFACFAGDASINLDLGCQTGKLHVVSLQSSHVPLGLPSAWQISRNAIAFHNLILKDA
jgi:hypothetical protein